MAEQLRDPGRATADAALTFKPSTAARPDHIRFAMLASQRGGVAQSELGDLVSAVLRTSALPIQQLVVEGGLLGKKSRGNRVIAIIAAFSSAVIRLAAPPLRAWDRAAAVKGDTAAPGKDATVSIAVRATLAETAVEKGYVVIRIFWDIEKFFDSLSIEMLVEQSEAHSMPTSAQGYNYAEPPAPSN